MNVLLKHIWLLPSGSWQFYSVWWSVLFSYKAIFDKWISTHFLIFMYLTLSWKQKAVEFRRHSFHDITNRCSVRKLHINFPSCFRFRKDGKKHYFMANNIVYHRARNLCSYFFMCFFISGYLWRHWIFLWIFSNSLQEKMLLLRSVKMSYDREAWSSPGKFYGSNLCFVGWKLCRTSEKCSAIVNSLRVWKVVRRVNLSGQSSSAGSYWILKGFEWA